jgi:hypothetical protein
MAGCLAPRCLSPPNLLLRRQQQILFRQQFAQVARRLDGVFFGVSLTTIGGAIGKSSMAHSSPDFGESEIRDRHSHPDSRRARA